MHACAAAPQNHLPSPHISPREREVLVALLGGLSEKQVAGSLGISVHTVHVYVKRLYRAHDVASRVGLLCRWVNPDHPGLTIALQASRWELDVEPASTG